MENKRKPLYWIFIKSFTDSNSYKHFVSKNFLRAFLYIVILTLLLSLAFSTFYVASIDSYATDLINQLNTNTPSFIIENGKLSTQAEQPIVIFETSNKGTLIVINTEYNGSVTKYEEYETVIVLSLEDIYMSNASISYFVNYETLLGIEQITSAALLESITSAKPYMYIFLYITMFLMFLINYLSYTLLIALVIGIARRLRKKPTHLATVMQLSVYAITLPALLYTLWMFTSLNILFGDFIFIVLAYFIAWKGIDSYYKQTQPKIEDKDKLV